MVDDEKRSPSSPLLPFYLCLPCGVREFPNAMCKSAHREGAASTIIPHKSSPPQSAQRMRRAHLGLCLHVQPSRKEDRKMISVSARRFLRTLLEILVFIAMTLAVVALLSAAQAQQRVVQKSAQSPP